MTLIFVLLDTESSSEYYSILVLLLVIVLFSLIPVLEINFSKLWNYRSCFLSHCSRAQDNSDIPFVATVRNSYRDYVTLGEK